MQVAGFEALLSASSARVGKAAVMPVGLREPISSRPAVQENEVTTIIGPAAAIDPDLLPMLVVFGEDAAHETISVVSQFNSEDEVSIVEIESDDAFLAQRDCAEIIVPTPVIIPTPIASPASARSASPNADCLGPEREPPPLNLIVGRLVDALSPE